MAFTLVSHTCGMKSILDYGKMQPHEIAKFDKVASDLMVSLGGVHISKSCADYLKTIVDRVTRVE